MTLLSQKKTVLLILFLLFSSCSKDSEEPTATKPEHNNNIGRDNHTDDKPILDYNSNNQKTCKVAGGSCEGSKWDNTTLVCVQGTCQTRCSSKEECLFGSGCVSNAAGQIYCKANECRSYLDDSCGNGRRCLLVEGPNHSKGPLSCVPVGSKKLGESCEVASECGANALCVEAEGKKTCTEICSRKKGCSGGKGCLGYDMAILGPIGIGVCQDNVCNPKEELNCKRADGTTGGCVAVSSLTGSCEKVGTKGEYEVCDASDDKMKCAAGLVCARLDEKTYCVRRCATKGDSIDSACNDGTHQGYSCVEAVDSDSPFPASNGICVRKCALSEVSAPADDASTCPENANDLCRPTRLYGPLCLIPAVEGTLGYGAECSVAGNSPNELCKPGMYCDPKGDQTKGICRSYCDFPGDANNQFACYKPIEVCTSNGVGGAHLGVCRQKCTPTNRFVDETCPEGMKSCHEMSQQSYFCSANSGTKGKGEVCQKRAAKIKEESLIDINLLPNECNTGLTCVTESSTSTIKGATITANDLTKFNSGTCQEVCNPYSDQPQGCAVGTKCGLDISEVGFKQVGFSGICLSNGKNPADGKFGDKCTDLLLPCGSGTICIGSEPGNGKCFVLCDLKSGSCKDGEEGQKFECQNPFGKEKGDIHFGICSPKS